jgi:acyl-CoA thioesterase FadM
MARAKISLPDKFIFHTDIAVRIGDINYGGHLGNDALLALLQEARLRFLNNYNFSERDVAGAGIIMTDAVVIYKSQAFYGDVLRVSVTANDFSKRACDLIYSVVNTAKNKEVARAKTRIAFFDYNQNKTVQIPAVFRQLFDSSKKIHFKIS